MELEQIYNQLFDYWEKLPEPKVNWEKAFYGGIKETIEKRLAYPLVEKPNHDFKVAWILKERLEIGGFDDCLPDEIADIEEWIHKIFLLNGMAKYARNRRKR